MTNIENKISDAQPPFERQLTRWIQVIQGPLMISIGTSSATFLAFILLYRELQIIDAGVFTLVMAIVQLLMLVAGLGQPTLILRMYSQTSNSAFNWPRDLATSIILALPIILLISAMAILIYEIRTFHIVLIFFTSTFQIAVLAESQMLNATQHYGWGNALLRLPHSLLILPALTIMLLNLESALDTVLTFYSVLTACTSLFGLFLLYKYLPRGRRKIVWKERMNGVIFLFTQSSYTLPEQGMVAIAGGLLTPPQLAIYGAMAVILKPFDLLTSVLRTILTSELIRKRDQKRFVLALSLWTVGIIALGLALIFGEAIMNLLYASRYVKGAVLIPWLALAGLFRLVEILPRSYIVGNAGQPGLRRFVLWQILVAIIVLTFGGWMISNESVVAVTWTMVLIQAGRFLVSSRFYRETQAQSLDIQTL